MWCHVVALGLAALTTLTVPCLRRCNVTVLTSVTFTKVTSRIQSDSPPAFCCQNGLFIRPELLE